MVGLRDVWKDIAQTPELSVSATRRLLDSNHDQVEFLDVFASRIVPEEAAPFLMFAPSTSGADWGRQDMLEESLMVTKQPVVPEAEHNAMKEKGESCSRNILLVCSGEGKDYARGYCVNATHPLLPSGLGEVLDTRFVITGNRVNGKNHMTSFYTSLLAKGFMTISVVFVENNDEISVVSVVTPQDPTKVLYQLVSVEDPKTMQGERLQWDDVDDKQGVWHKVRKIMAGRGASWRNMSIQCRRRETDSLISTVFSHEMPVFVEFTADQVDTFALKQQFVRSIVTRFVDAPIQLAICSSSSEDSSSRNPPPTKVDQSVGTGPKWSQRLSRRRSLLRSALSSEKELTASRLDLPPAQDWNKEDRSSVSSRQKQSLSCPVCAVPFKRKYEMTRHVDTVHIGVRKHNCPICHKNFSQATHVRVHINTVHENKRSEVCTECGVAFGTKGKLTRHRRAVHERERTFLCKPCGKSYFQNSDLKRHVRQCHNEEV